MAQRPSLSHYQPQNQPTGFSIKSDVHSMLSDINLPAVVEVEHYSKCCYFLRDITKSCLASLQTYMAKPRVYSAGGGGGGGRERKVYWDSPLRGTFLSMPSSYWAGERAVMADPLRNVIFSDYKCTAGQCFTPLSGALVWRIRFLSLVIGVAQSCLHRWSE